jgi:hypothetical protein
MALTAALALPQARRGVWFLCNTSITNCFNTGVSKVESLTPSACRKYFVGSQRGFMAASENEWKKR